MDLRDLYQEVILDHNKRPRNFRVPDPVNRKAEGYNPLCGDKITVFLYVEGDTIKDLAFQGTGCAISKASASMMTDELKGKTLREADAFFEKFHTMLTAPATSEVEMRRARQARRAVRCPRVSDAREVREPRMAHDEGCHEGRARSRLHGVTRHERPHCPARRCAGPVSDAPEAAPALAEDAFSPDPLNTLKFQPALVEAVSKVFDPEIPVNIYELGLVYTLEVDSQLERAGADDADGAGVPGGTNNPDRRRAPHPRSGRRQRGEGEGRMGPAVDARENV